MAENFRNKFLISHRDHPFKKTEKVKKEKSYPINSNIKIVY